MSLTIQTVEHELDAIGPQIAALLPPDVPLDKFRQVALAAIRNNASLLNCDRQSLFNACLNAAQDGLMPDGQEGAIVPRKGKAVWQPMIKGIYKRVKTSGSVASLSANVVYDGEEFDVLLGDDDRIVHRRDMNRVGKGNEVAVYAIATLRDGTKEREVMTWQQVQDVRKASAMPNSGPWTEWADEMARKTVVRRLAKRLPVLDPADEAMHRTIGRVDSLYDFGTAAQEAPSGIKLPSEATRALMQPAAAPSPSRREAINAETPLRAAERAPAAPESTPQANGSGAKKRTVGEFLAGLRLAVADAKRVSNAVEQMDRVICADEVLRMKEYLARQPSATGLDELNAIITEGLLFISAATTVQNAPEHDESDELLPEVEIAGEAKMAAGD